MSGAFEITPAFSYDVWLQRSAVLAGYTWLVYDYFLTLSDEVEYIWKARWTPVKFIYLANRYIVLLGQTFVSIQETGLLAAVTGGCNVYAIFLSGYTLVFLETAHVLVVLRAWATWGGNRRILRFVVVGYVVGLITLAAAVGQGEDFSNLGVSVMSVCYEPTPDHAWLFYFCSLMVDSLLFCMTMSGLWSYRKSLRNGSLALVKALTRDVTAFYIVNVCYDVLGIVSVTKYANNLRSSAITGITVPALAICCQRVMHDLRRMAPVSLSLPELSQVVNRQLAASPPEANGAIEEISMVLTGSSGLEREMNSNIDGTGVATSDNDERRVNAGARILVGTPASQSMSYSPATILGTSVSV